MEVRRFKTTLDSMWALTENGLLGSGRDPVGVRAYWSPDSGVASVCRPRWALLRPDLAPALVAKQAPLASADRFQC